MGLIETAGLPKYLFGNPFFLSGAEAFNSASLDCEAAMLALDQSLNRIETSEADILDLFDSLPLPINVTGSRSERHTAYVCAIKKENTVRVYVALAPNHGRTFVYTDSGDSCNSGSHEAAIEEALQFARSMGFLPERVNLDYSPAMRAVVVRNYKIFKFPTKGNTIKPNAANLSHEKVAAAPNECQIVLSESHAPLAPVAVAAAVGAASASAAFNQDAVTEVIRRFGSELADLRAERDALSLKGQELAAAQERVFLLTRDLEESRRIIVSLSTENARSAEVAAKADEEAARVNGEAAKAKDDLARAIEEATNAKDEAARAREAAAKAKEEIARANDDAARANEDLARVSQEAAKATEEAARASEDAAVAKESAARAREEAADAKKELATAKENAARAEGQVAELKKQAVRLTQERNDTARRIDEALEKKDVADSEIKDSIRQLETVGAERDAALRRIEELEQEVAAKDADIVAIRSQLSLLAAQQEQTPPVELVDANVATPAKEVVKAGTCPAKETVSAQPEPTLWELADLPDHLSHSETEATPIGFEVAEIAPDTDKTSSSSTFETGFPAFPPFSNEMLSPAAPSVPFSGFGSADDRFFGDTSDESAENVFFELKNDTKTIEYSSSQDVVQLYKSYNAAYVAPDGKTQERSEGYICCVRTQETVQVFTAIYGMESGRVGIYAPTAQPSDEDGVAATVAGAFTFHQQIGLMMQQIDLKSSKKGREAIASCPVLEQINCQALVASL